MLTVTACVDTTLEKCEKKLSTRYDSFDYMQGLMSLWLKVGNLNLTFQ